MDSVTAVGKQIRQEKNVITDDVKRITWHNNMKQDMNKVKYISRGDQI